LFSGGANMRTDTGKRFCCAARKQTKLLSGLAPN
jgi:hypothetical protein